MSYRDEIWSLLMDRYPPRAWCGGGNDDDIITTKTTTIITIIVSSSPESVALRS
jgi:hypothetical protein